MVFFHGGTLCGKVAHCSRKGRLKARLRRSFAIGKAVFQAASNAIFVHRKESP
ncbi:hypothetical protein HMPREF9123_0235 [Neisseria bacilliformis ATCC BAA-1200]|uniref:Uncharacterized protein n=1 Tax=Neisseria bacilliformis ATCC BAA-1200 TaxID=888742 RepID=F2B925_9NEIS|nr:hypothetical protein HMPREF9123_0235 [Neisseria bacilliformis ATCC BAA-1200]